MFVKNLLNLFEKFCFFFVQNILTFVGVVFYSFDDKVNHLFIEFHASFFKINFNKSEHVLNHVLRKNNVSKLVVKRNDSADNFFVLHVHIRGVLDNKLFATQFYNCLIIIKLVELRFDCLDNDVLVSYSNEILFKF